METAERRMMADEKTIVNVFMNMPVAVHARHIAAVPEDGALDLAGSIIVNDAYCQLTGYTPHEIETVFGCELNRMVIDGDRERLMQEIRALSAYPQERTVSFRVRRKDGQRLRVRESMRSIRQADGSVWLYGAVTHAEAERADGPMEAPRREAPQKRMQVYTFGYLHILIDGKPVVFQHEKARELLALLIDRQGRFVSSGEIISCLWEDEPVNENTQGRCRKAVYHLRKTLAAHGLEELLESTPKGYRRIRAGMIDCDLYRYLQGDEAEIKRFRGAYMSDYSWAEQTLTMLTYGK